MLRLAGLDPRLAEPVNRRNVGIYYATPPALASNSMQTAAEAKAVARESDRRLV